MRATTPLRFSSIFRSAGPETETLPEVETVVIEEVTPPWNVVVLNDPVNLMNYVTMVIQKIFGYGRSQAKKMMMEVHSQGRSIVWTGEREQAEHYVQQLHGYQLMAVIEKVEQ